jgi:hypothetical protein
VSPEARDAILTGDQEKVAKLVGMALGSHTSTITLGKQLHKKKKNKKKESRKAASKPTKA